MLLNYFKTSVRNLIKNKYFSIINIMGLALGITCVFLIVQYLKREIAYDQFHTRASDIYRVAWKSNNPQTRTPHPLAQAMVQDFPEVEAAVSITPLWGAGLTRETFSIANEEKNVQYEETNILAVDTTFFEVFSFPIVKGNPETALKKIGGILLSEKAATKYFGDADPIGKFLSVNDEKTLVEVVAVFEDVPELSHFHFDFLVSYVTEKALEGPDSEFFTWSDFGHYNYVKLKPGADAMKLQPQLIPWLKKYVDWAPETFAYFEQNKYGFELQPITDIHLKSDLRWELESNGNIEYVYMMTAAAILILLIACINFINLTTAQSAERAKEIGIRKSLGAFRSQLIVQFTGESTLIALVAMVLAIGLIQVSLPVFNVLNESAVTLDSSSVVFIIVALTIFVGIVAGIYPSFFLSAVKPTEVLKGKILQSPKGSMIRSFFTVFQFAASMILICASAIIYNQLDSIRHRSIGFNRDEVIVLPIKNEDMFDEKGEDFMEELKNIPGVSSVAATTNIPGRGFDQNAIYASFAPDHSIDASELFVSHEFLRTLDIKIVEGRNFLRENPADLENAFLLNETAVNNLSLNNPVGKEITWERNEVDVKGIVIGVVKDFNFQSLHQTVKPLLIKLSNRHFNYVLIKINTGDFQTTIQSIESSWKKFEDRFAFDFFFLSDSVNRQYQAEENISKVLIAFAFTAIVIACLGLLGIAALTFRTKTKEVSIRKVLGASVKSILFLLVKDFTLLILISIIVATPVVWWLMEGWLENFSYRIQISPLVFIAAGAGLIFLAWMTLLYLTLNVARVNPATTLKNE
jgi:putative ABC transport system permease protein